MKYRNFSVTAVLNGFIIEMGCQKAVASSADELIELITEYMKDPGSMETKMLNQSFVFGEGFPRDMPSTWRQTSESVPAPEPEQELTGIPGTTTWERLHGLE